MDTNYQCNLACKVLCKCVRVYLCGEGVSVCRPAVFILLSSERRLQIVSECVMEKPVESYATLTYECMRVAPYVCQ